jgi:hypothetical protein
MSKKDLWTLAVVVGLAAAVLLGALGYAAIQNIKADNARIEREQVAAPVRQAEAQADYARRVAFWKTPEGQAKRKAMEAAAVAEKSRQAAGVDRVQVSGWDGSVEEAKAFIRRSVADPSAVKFNDWRHIVNDAVHVVRVDFTTVNADGGPVRLNWAFTFQKQSGKLILVADGQRILHKDF